MPRAEPGSLKAIGNRIKSVGLQKLRWYCQMCQKQCRDENGFKCHTQSESHLRQMKLFAENSHGIIDEFSRDFCRGFLEILSHRHGTKRIQANKVYQEYIAFKEHIHMNATMWTSLTEFCKYLGKESKAVVDETEKGWFIQYIDRDPKVLARLAAAESKQQSEIDYEERSRRMIKAQIDVAEELKRVRQGEAPPLSDDITAVVDSACGLEYVPGAAIKFGMAHAVVLETKKRKIIALNETALDNLHTRCVQGDRKSDSAELEQSKRVPLNPTSTSTTLSTLEQLKCEEESRKEFHSKQEDKRDRKENWLHAGIFVKVMNNTVMGGRLFKMKGTVRKVIDEFVGEIEVDSAIVRLDQAELETVVPKVGQTVLIVNGRCRGSLATMLRIHEDRYNCDVRIDEGVHAKRELYGVDYEDISRVDVS